MLAWLRARGSPWDEVTCAAAAGGFRRETDKNWKYSRMSAMIVDYEPTKRGDHLALLRCYNEWVDTNYSTQW